MARPDERATLVVHGQHQLRALVVGVAEDLAEDHHDDRHRRDRDRSTRSRSTAAWSRRRRRSGRPLRSSCAAAVAWRPYLQCPRPLLQLKATNLVCPRESEERVSHVGHRSPDSTAPSRQPRHPPAPSDSPRSRRRAATIPTRPTSPSTAWRASSTATCRRCWSAASDHSSSRCSIPHTMAGVAQHSRYREDPLGRLLQTANFIGFTTYGTKAQAVRVDRAGPRRAPGRARRRRRRRYLLRQRPAPARLGARRRDVDVPHGLPALRHAFA